MGWNRLIALVREQRLAYDRALLNDIGHGNPNVMSMNTLPLHKAERKSETMNAVIDELLQAESTPEPAPPSAPTRKPSA